MSGQFNGKVALVTGAGSGIGRASAIGFAREGAKVAVVDISSESGEETVRMIRSADGEAVFFKADVSRAEDVERLVDEIVRAFGRLDCAHNNAGITGDTVSTVDCSLENWDSVMNLNLRGTFLCLKYEIPQMIKQGGGAIVNTSSIMGVVAHGQNSAYVASKHGIIGLTKSTALAYVKENIRVNAICPGNTETPIFDTIKSERAEIFAGLMMATPIGRLARPEEIANAVIWLCSDSASFCNGHALVVDGCYSIQ